jgi:hypothetical protein
MKKQLLGILTVISSFGLLAGCSSARDVALTGTVTADAAVSGGPVRVEFYEPQAASGDAATAADLKFVEAMSLDSPSKFTHTVSIEGDKIHVVAFIDSDKNDKCTDGEAWGESDVAIQKDDTATVSLNVVAATKCPALPAAN